MQQVLDIITSTLAEVVVIALGVLASWALGKTIKVLDRIRKKDELGIINIVTDRAVEYAEAELMGENGSLKRDYAIEKSLEMLSSKGIEISKTELLAGIENGVNKLKAIKQQQIR